MDVTIVGASGGCGREMVAQIIQQRLLESREILQLVGSNPQSSRPHLLNGFRADLQDAFAEIIPEINVTTDPDSIIGDIVVITGGATFSVDAAEIGSASRDILARENAKVFHRFGRAIASHGGSAPPIVIVVTNPVELGVAILNEYLPRTHVIGMGGYSDSARFRWEIASDLGIRRQRVSGYMLGEHGDGIVPLWSSVKVQGMMPSEWRIAETKLRRNVSTAQYPEALAYHRQKMVEMITGDPRNGAVKALGYVRTLPPDLRVPLKPFAIHYTGAKTPTATAAATVDLIRCVLEGRTVEVVAQYVHQGENGIYGPCGGRLLLSGSVLRVLPNESNFCEDELRLIQRAADNINQKIKRWCTDE